MNPKTTAVLFAIAAALAAFVYFYAIEGEQARVEAKAAEKRLFPDVEQGEIASISLRASDAPEIRLERLDGRWRIVAPIDFAAVKRTGFMFCVPAITHTMIGKNPWVSP